MMIRLKLGKWMLASVTTLGLLLFSAGIMPAETGVVVTTIEEESLDNLIKNKNNKLIIGFMAAWCGPCIDELPVLNNLYRKYKDRGLQLVGISIDLEGAAAIQPAVSAHKVEFPVYWYGEAAIQKFNLSAIPLLLIIKQGKIWERIPGRRNQQFLDKKIQQILD